MRVSWLLPFALLACSVSATVDATSRPAPADPEPPAPALNPVDGGYRDAADSGTEPDADAAPTGPTTVRTCGEPGTTPVPLVKYNLVARTVPVVLGAAVIDGRPSATERWATGPARFVLNPGLTGAWSKGVASDEADLLYHLGQENVPDLFADHPGGKTPFQTWASTLAATARRLTYLQGGFLARRVYSLDDATRTPTTPAAGAWVRTVRPSRTYLFALAVTFASDCALGAMSDLLGRKPFVTSSLGNDGLLDASKRAAIQDLLVRDGAEVMLAFATHKPVAAVDDLMETTTCGPTDLSACEAALKVLDEWDPFPAAIDERPTYEALVEGTDPSWSITSFTTSSVSTLP